MKKEKFYPLYANIEKTTEQCNQSITKFVDLVFL